ncbi:MAG: prepilin-type N-terminal cleavage/methylation domain-containing protein [Proteobacteria bacterium]|nr:prepilin-type N-terminal cleavage/methylation domain-containing protein [Pseudomonadota bacterium]MBU4133590.1 prepilin-type N-terminal cleavage/methylation domain-containing protein [Pseudomonadota bacterium]
MGVNRSEAGFTLIELMVVVAVIGIVSVLAIPSMGDMIKEYKLRSGCRAVVSSLQNLKLRAIKENARTVMIIDPVLDIYTTFVDNSPRNWALDLPELISKTNVRDEGLEISSNFGSNTFGFDNRGFLEPITGGEIILTKDATRSKKIVLNTLGNIRVE